MKTKLLIYTLILFIITTAFGQKQYPRVEKVVVNQKLFRGYIANYPITLYLKYHSLSNYSRGMYSVKGWYYYDKVQKKIPLVGFCYGSEMYLYHFKDATQADEILSFKTVKANPRAEYEYYKNLSNYTEKFSVNTSGGQWENTSKNHSLKIAYNGSILNTYEYLHLGPSNSINLNNVAPSTRNFELVAWAKNKCLLHFNFMSGSNSIGFCGAGEEAGYLQLEWDEKNFLKHYIYDLYESCFSGIYSELKNDEGGKIKTYTCITADLKSRYVLQIDLDRAQMTKKILNN